jgi:putative two-component system response regulator
LPDLDALACLARAEGLSSPKLERHENRVGNLASLLCHAVSDCSSIAHSMKLAARFHDIGKLVVPEPILNKPGPLTADEWEIIKKHPVVGHKIMSAADDPILALSSVIALSHHENYDGTGYPSGLTGDAIPLAGRIAMVCDVYDALREDRPYKTARTHDEAIAIMTEGDRRTRPSQFDPAFLSAFVKAGVQVEQIYLSQTVEALGPFSRTSGA